MNVPEPITVNVAEPLTPPLVAEMVACPSNVAVAKPVELTAATRVAEELHMIPLVKGWVVPSEYVPVAVNC
jgi:hypothetical protein